MQRRRCVVGAGAEHGQAPNHLLRGLRAQSCHRRVQMVPNRVDRDVTD